MGKGTDTSYRLKKKSVAIKSVLSALKFSKGKERVSINTFDGGEKKKNHRLPINGKERKSKKPEKKHSVSSFYLKKKVSSDQILTSLIRF